MSGARPTATRGPAAHRRQHDRPEDWAAFCSHCGREPAGGRESRVCAHCGMGLVLGCPAEVAPEPGASFLVVDHALAVGAVSRGAERFLGIEESGAVHRPVTELIEGADAEPSGVDLGAAILRSAQGDPTARRLFVRPAGTFGVRCCARIGPCGPPSAAVVILED